MSGMRANADLRSFNIWGVGGPAALLAEPRGAEELGQALAAGKGAVYMLGLGSNILALDEGFDGTVIVTHRHLRDLRREEDGDVYAQCGVAQAKLARFLAKESLQGGEFHAGIPGTLGGALAMNAGAFGAETWDNVVSVDVIDRKGALSTRSPGDFDVSYRRVEGLAEGEYFLGARLRFEPGGSERVSARISELIKQRNATQPIGVRSCGSVFVNPRPESAGRLIDQCGLKGYRIGGAEISTLHANFIVNTGGALARDILGLVAHARRQVAMRFGQELSPEFRILAEPGVAAELLSMS